MEATQDGGGMMPTDFGARRDYLLKRQKQIEAELQLADRRERDALESEYANVTMEMERMDSGTWRPQE